MTVTVPGAQIREVKVTGQTLAVVLFEESSTDADMTVQHRNEAVVAALGREIAAIVSDAAPSGSRRPVQRQLVSVWPLRVLADLRNRVRHGSPWWRRALWYMVLGFPLAVLLPVEPRLLGPVAWLLLPLGVASLRAWVSMAELDKRWVMWRRGITVRARFESDPHRDRTSSYIVHFRTLDGRKVTVNGQVRGHREEIRYDPQDSSRVLVPTRVAWLGVALAAFMLIGFWGVVFSIPAVLWLIGLLALPF